MKLCIWHKPLGDPLAVFKIIQCDDQLAVTVCGQITEMQRKSRDGIARNREELLDFRFAQQAGKTFVLGIDQRRMAENFGRGIPVARVERIFDCPIVLKHRLALAAQHGKLGVNLAHVTDEPVQTAFKQLGDQQRHRFWRRVIDAYDGQFGNGAQAIKLRQNLFQLILALLRGGNRKEGNVFARRSRFPSPSTKAVSSPRESLPTLRDRAWKLWHTGGISAPRSQEVVCST